MSSPIAITGATGHIGGLVVEDLASHDAPLRLLVRDPARAPRGFDDVRRAPYDDPAAARSALEGVQTLFMISAVESADRLDQHRAFIDAAAAAGVRHLVYTSFLGAGEHATFTLARDHWVTEEHIRASGMRWTFLRDSFYLDLLPSLAGADGVIRGPAGDGRVSAVARADVARSAAAVLLDPSAHADTAYDLTGPQALSFPEIARTITEVTGRPTTFHDETLAEARQSRASYDPADWELDAWISTYTAIAAGEMATVSQDVKKLTGREPVSLVELLQQG